MTHGQRRRSGLLRRDSVLAVVCVPFRCYSGTREDQARRLGGASETDSGCWGIPRCCSDIAERCLIERRLGTGTQCICADINTITSSVYSYQMFCVSLHSSSTKYLCTCSVLRILCQCCRPESWLPRSPTIWANQRCFSVMNAFRMYCWHGQEGLILGPGNAAMPSGCRKCPQCSEHKSCNLFPELKVLTQQTKCGQVFCISMLDNPSSVQTRKPTPRAIKRYPDICYAAHGIACRLSKPYGGSVIEASDGCFEV